MLKDTCVVCREGGERCQTTDTGHCIILRSCSPGSCRWSRHKLLVLRRADDCSVTPCRIDCNVLPENGCCGQWRGRLALTHVRTTWAQMHVTWRPRWHY